MRRRRNPLLDGVFVGRREAPAAPLVPPPTDDEVDARVLRALQRAGVPQTAMAVAQGLPSLTITDVRASLSRLLTIGRVVIIAPASNPHFVIAGE